MLVQEIGETTAEGQTFRIDTRLIGGAAIFGVGWGLSGLCPGPALVLLGLDLAKAGVFVAALIVGAWVAGFAPNRRPAPAPQHPIHSAS